MRLTARQRARMEKEAGLAQDVAWHEMELLPKLTYSWKGRGAADGRASRRGVPTNTCPLKSFLESHTCAPVTACAVLCLAGWLDTQTKRTRPS